MELQRSKSQGKPVETYITPVYHNQIALSNVHNTDFNSYVLSQILLAR